MGGAGFLARIGVNENQVLDESTSLVLAPLMRRHVVVPLEFRMQRRIVKEPAASSGPALISWRSTSRIRSRKLCEGTPEWSRRTVTPEELAGLAPGELAPACGMSGLKNVGSPMLLLRRLLAHKLHGDRCRAACRYW